MRGRGRRRPVVSVLAIAAVLAAAGAGWWLWDAYRFPAASATLAGTPITMRVQDGLDSRQVDAFRRGLEASARYLARRTGRAVRRPVEARLAFGDPCEPFGDPGRGSTGIADEGFLCVDALVPWWRSAAGSDSAVATSVSAHELVHAWQAEGGCLPDAEDHELLWLVEGTAMAFSWQALVDAGVARRRDVVDQLERMGPFAARLGPLRDYERRGGADPEYALWHLAVRDLERRSGRDAARATAAVCAAVGEGRSWREAFAGGFGLSVNRFYAAFEAARPQYRTGTRSL